MRITSGGNVGIGTTSPSARLNIAGALGSTVGGGGSAIKMTNTDTGNYASISAGIVGITNSGMEFSIDGGSINYVKLLTKDFEHKIRKSSKVVSVKKSGNKIIVTDSNSKSEEFDRVIFANHPDEILEICKDLSSNSADLLANFKYQTNEVILHRDINIMPKKKAAWASWVYNKKRFDRAGVTKIQNR